MEIKKCIRLTESEIKEALQEYLSRRNIAYEVEDIYTIEDNDGNFEYLEVITN